MGRREDLAKRARRRIRVFRAARAVAHQPGNKQKGIKTYNNQDSHVVTHHTAEFENGFHGLHGETMSNPNAKPAVKHTRRRALFSLLVIITVR